MHCEKCGSADTEVTRCGKCGQKSLIRCHNCGYQVCADKYCEVISIKRKIRLLTYFAMFLIFLMVIILPVVFVQAWDEDPEPTARPTPTQVATKPPATPTQTATKPPVSPTQVATKPATPKPPTPQPPTSQPATKPPQKPPGVVLQERRDAVRDLGRKLVQQKLGYKKKSSDPKSGGLDFVGFVQHVLQEANVVLPRSPAAILKAGRRINGTDALLPGDVLVFSKKPGSKTPNFLGVYLGGGKFGCSYPGKGVIEIDLGHKFWKPRYLFAVRTIR